MGMKLGVIAGGVVALGLAYGGSSWWLGQKAEEAWQQEFEKTVLRLGASRVVSSHYQRGIFESGASSVVEVLLPLELLAGEPDDEADEPDAGDEADGVDDSAAADEAAQDEHDGADEMQMKPLRLHLTQVIRHGPLVGGKLAAALIETRLAKVEGAGAHLRKAFSRASPPVVDTVIGLDRSVEGTMLLPAGEVFNPGFPADLARWEAMNYRFTRSADRRNGSDVLKWGGGSWTLLSQQQYGDAGLEFKLGEIRAQYDIAGKEPGQWMMAPGSYRVEAGHLGLRLLGASATKQDVTVLSLQDWRTEGTISQSAGQLEAVEKGSGKAVLMDVPMKRLSYDTSLSGIQTSLVGTLEALILQINQEDDPMAVLALMSDEGATGPLLQGLLDGKPAYRMQIEGLAEGVADTLPLQLGIHGHLVPLAGAPEGLPAAMKLLQRLEIGLDLSLPKAWQPLVEGAIKNVTNPRHQQDCLLECWYLVDQGDRWTMKLKYVGKRGLYLNGRRVSQGF